MIPSRTIIGAVALVASASATLAAEPPAKIALTGARIITVTGQEIPKGTILIENGLITAVGADLEIPYDAMETDLSGKVVMPGMIDPHSWRGLDIPNENVSVAPFLTVYDAIDPSKVFFEQSLRDGVTTIHIIQANNCVIGGVSRTLRPIGLTPTEMTVQPEIALKMSASPKNGFDRMAQLATLREAFAELADYEMRLAEKRYEEDLKEKNKPLDAGPKEARERGKALIKDEHYDERHLNLMRLKRGDLGAWIYCGDATDVSPAVNLATEQGFIDRTVLVLGENAHRALKEIKASKRPVILPPDLFEARRDPLTGEIEKTFLPTKFQREGILFALQPNPNASLAERYLNYQAAVCVRNGMSREDAIKAITINPAQILGLESRLGSVEPQKVANLVVFSGDPLDFQSWVELVYIDGVLAYDRARDHRLQQLINTSEKSAAAAEAAKPKPAATEDPKTPPKGDETTPAKPDAPPADGAKDPAPGSEPKPDQPAPTPPGGRA